MKQYRLSTAAVSALSFGSIGASRSLCRKIIKSRSLSAVRSNSQSHGTNGLQQFEFAR